MPSTVLSPRATYVTAVLRSAGRSRASSWPPHAHPADSVPSAASAKRLRFTGSPRPVGPQPHDGLRLARSGPQARLGLRGPSPTTACGSHYHAAASSRVRRYQSASGEAIGRVAGGGTPASREAATDARAAAASPTVPSAAASVAGAPPSPA